MIWCCKDCTERYVGCHGKCEKYIKQREEHDNQRREAQKADAVRRYKNDGLRKYLNDQAKRKKHHNSSGYRYI